MRRAATAAFLAACMSAASAQQLDLSVHVLPTLSPYFSEWLNIPNSVWCDVRNPTALSYAVRAHVSIRSTTGGLVCFTDDSRAERTISISGPLTTLFVSDLLDESALVFLGKMSRSVGSGKKFPSDYYSISIKLLRLGDLQPISPERSAEFSIFEPTPPSLQSPQNNSAVTIPYPLFQWTPVSGAGAARVSYSLVVVPVLPGQAPRRAIETNLPHFKSFTDIQTPFFIYPPSAPPLSYEQTKLFAWQVQAIDPDGHSIGTNDGKSEIFTFEVRSPVQVVDSFALELPGGWVRLVVEDRRDVAQNDLPPILDLLGLADDRRSLDIARLDSPVVSRDLYAYAAHLAGSDVATTALLLLACADTGGCWTTTFAPLRAYPADTRLLVRTLSDTASATILRLQTNEDSRGRFLDTDDPSLPRLYVKSATLVILSRAPFPATSAITIENVRPVEAVLYRRLNNVVSLHLFVD